jgi:beta-galactosidase
MKRLLIIVFLICARGFGQQTSQHTFTTPHAPLLGSAWYPEQWPEARWEADLELMEKAGMNVTRVGEFAWSTMEPSEGHFDLDWLARAIRLAEKHHIAVVIGTPTDAPPAWLTTKYPDTLGTDANGQVRQHGGRRQFSFSSPRYRELCVRIATALAQRFGHDPNVIGWQVGNEFTDESFDAATRKQFQDYLQRKFKTLDALNQRWTTTYWSQTYDNWEQIPLNNLPNNPGLMLEHRHFVTETWRSFQRAQIDAIRPLADKRQFITTNIGGLGWSDNWDHYVMNEDLDLASWDAYVGTGHLNVARNAFMNDFVRGWKHQNFWVMETQPGFVNWAPTNNSLYRGETRALAWQAVGHGADALLYWQWRNALNGQEQYHGAIVGPDGNPLPLYDEVQQTGEEFKRTSAAIAGTSPVADVAILADYDSRWAIDFQPHNKDYDQLEVLLDYYRQFSKQGRTVDVISAYAPLAKYKLVVAPGLNVIPQKLADHLLEYVRNGGHLVLGPRSGMKDEFNALDIRRQPGPLVDALGGRVEQYYALDAPVPVKGDQATGTATIWAEQLSATNPDTKVLLRYGKSNGWLDDQPAAISRTLGRGNITYIGALVDEKTLSQLLKPFEPGVPAFFKEIPDSVELCRRTAPGREILILINHGKNAAEIQALAPVHDLLNNTTSTSISLPTQGVAVLETNPTPRNSSN